MLQRVGRTHPGLTVTLLGIGDQFAEMKGMCGHEWTVYRDCRDNEIVEMFRTVKQAIEKRYTLKNAQDEAPIDLVKKTMRFFIDKFQHDQDRIGLVAFGDEVEQIFPLTRIKQSKQTRQVCLLKVNEIKTEGNTNLSGGISMGMRMIRRSQQQQPTKTRAIFLLTDGEANMGETTTDAIITRCGLGGLQGPVCPINTFGFGPDHDPNMLMEIADVTGGSYYHIEPRTMGKVLVDCCAGVMTKIGHHLRLTVTPAFPSIRILDSTPKKPDPTLSVGGKYVIDLGDIQSEERRDTIFKLHIPPIAQDARRWPLATVELSYMHAQANKEIRCEVDGGVKIKRDAGAGNQTRRDEFVDEQYNRCVTYEALDAAGKDALRGNVRQGQARLQQCIRTLQMSCSQNARSTIDLVRDIERVVTQMGRGKYEKSGHKILQQLKCSLQKQRSDGISNRFDTGARRDMKILWKEYNTDKSAKQW